MQTIKNFFKGDFIMNKKMREILAQIQAKTAEAKSFMDGENKDIGHATALMDEVDALQKEYDAEKRIYDAEKANGAQSAAATVEDGAQAKKTEDAVAKFAKAVRQFIKKGLVEGVDEDGGYTVPEDVSTRVEHYKDVDYALESDIDVVPVSTNKGARTYQKKTDVDTFVDIDENGEIANEIEAPKFERLPYAIQDRAGFMPVSNDLANDSDANIMEIVAEWLGKANVATTNSKVLAKVAEKAQVDLKDIDGIKKALNVTLGQAYKFGAKIYTNDDGLNYLDTLKDQNGRPMLNPDPTAPATLTLRCGTTVLPIKVLPNKVFKSNGTKVPFIVGNLFDYVRKYDRQSMSIKASDVASIGNFNAFAQNMTLLRAIVRDDYRVKDADSIVNGYIDTSVVGE
jgi:HK97 family phage major capsid protein